jgi:dipeptidase D
VSENSDVSFNPKAVCDHFMCLTKLSHPSGKENPVRKHVIECAQKIKNVEISYYEPDATDPGKKVIILRRKGSGEYTNAPYVTLQAHMDMVCQPNENIFELHVFGYRDEKGVNWIKAGSEDSISHPENGTTLGADDGIGVATILALLEDENLKDYPIECLFTVQEETDMGGAAGFDKNLLKGRKYINLDAEDAKTIIYGSAAGQDVQFEGNVTLEDIKDDFITLELSISGLLGGHSGVNINCGRLNAIKVITEALIRLNKRLTNLNDVSGKYNSYDLRLISLNSLKKDEIKNNEPVVNKIPTWVVARIALPKSEKDCFKNDFDAYIAALKKQVPEETNLEYSAVEVSSEDIISFQKSLDKASTDALLCLLWQIPHGIIHMIPDNTDVVETSSNLAVINSFGLKSDKIVIKSLNRSSDENSLDELVQIQKIIGKLFSYEVDAKKPSPIWEPKNDSDLLNKAKDVYQQIYPDYKATVIHAGLECGYIADYFGNEIECISIGPTIVSPHTGGEKLNTDTVKDFYNTVSNLIQKLFSE